MAIALVLAVFLGTFLIAAVAVIAGRRWLGTRLEEPFENPETAEEAGRDGSDWLTSFDSPNLIKADQLSTITFWDHFLARLDGIEILRMRIGEAGLGWSVGRVTAMMLLAGASTCAILLKMNWIPRYAAVLVGCLAGAAPYLMILRRRARRLRELELHFPDALDTLARAMRAGNTLGAALDVLAREGKPPLAGEIRKVVHEVSLGLTWERALQNLAERVPILEVSMFVATVQLQSRTGGRLHEVLMKLSESMREASALKGEVRAITAHGRLTGILLTFLPVVIAATMTYVNPAHMASLWNHPVGKDLIAAAVVCLITAHLVIRRMVDVKI